MLPTLSVVIVNWRSKNYLRRCLGALRDTCADLKPQIVVVDAASFDGCKEMLADEFPETRFVQSEENIGFAQCNNLALTQVTGEAVLLLNPDTEVRPNAVRLLLEELAAKPAVGLVAPRLLSTDGSLQTSCVQAFPTPWNQALDSVFLRRLFPRSALWGVAEAFSASDPVQVEAVSGACMMLPTRVLRQVGGFCPQYFMYGEDMDLCLQIRRAGLEVVHVPSSKVIHHGSGSSSQQIRDFSILLGRETNIVYMRRNHGRATATTYRILQGFSAVTRILLAALPASVLPARSSLRAAARTTVRKWWSVFRWAVGASRSNTADTAVGQTQRAPSIITPAAGSR